MTQHQADANFREDNERGNNPSAVTNHRTIVYWIILAVVVILNTADNVLVVVLFDNYTEVYSQFLNQGTAFVYIIVSSSILFVRWLPCCHRLRCFWDRPKEELEKSKKEGRATAPWWTLVGIGLFNGTANFFMGISQPHTPGLTQTLLYLLGVPAVMVLSAIFLKKRPTILALAGAALIVAGSGVSALREVLQPDDHSPIVVLWYSVMLFAIAQLFLSGEKVWEEASFTKFAKLDPMKMFWYTLVTQFVLGWALYPVQTLPEFGNITLANIPMVIVNGTLCSFGQPVPTSTPNSPCSLANTVIFFVYCAVDFWCYFFGLFVIQRGGANLMVMASAIALPLQQLVLCTPFLVHQWVESFFWGDAVALVLVLIGFGVYQFSREGKASRGVPSGARLNPTALEEPLLT